MTPTTSKSMCNAFQRDPSTAVKMAAAVGVSPLMSDEIRTLAQTKRIRVTEFFQDYDKLRSGYVTGMFSVLFC